MNDVTPLNYLVLVMGIIGTVVSVWGIISSLVEFISLNAFGINGARRITALTEMAREAFCLAAQNTVLLVGAALVLNRNQGIIGLVAWSTNSALITMGCLGAQYRRRKHRAIIRAEASQAIANGAKRKDDPRPTEDTLRKLEDTHGNS